MWSGYLRPQASGSGSDVCETVEGGEKIDVK